MLTTLQKIRIAKWLGTAVRTARRLANKPVSGGVVRRQGILWDLDLNEGIDLAIYLGVYEPSLVQFFRRSVRPGQVVLDIGANIGAHTMVLAGLVGDEGRVAAFEPTTYGFAKLQRHLALNPGLAARVMAVNALLTASDDEPLPEAIYSSWPLAGNEPLHPSHGGRLNPVDGARSVSLDRWVSDSGLARVDLIKMDVDGNEPAVFEGAWATIRRFRPDIVFEIARDEVEGDLAGFSRSVLGMAELGYRFTSLCGRHRFPSDPAGLARQAKPGASLNALAKAVGPS